MLILPRQRLVFLEVPKSASTSIRRTLVARGVALDEPYGPNRPRHISAPGFLRRLAAPLEAELGGPVETFCVVREPLDRLHSWYRYRQRDKIDGLEASTRDMDFAAFIALCLGPKGHPAARVGRQDAFVGYADGKVQVDHVFDFARLDLLQEFLSGRAGVDLRFGRKNVSHGTGTLSRPDLPAALMDRLRQANATEFELYDRVRAAGVLRRG